LIIVSTVLKPPSPDRETFLDKELEALRFPDAMYQNCPLCEDHTQTATVLSG
jgi:hypothetical protein